MIRGALVVAFVVSAVAYVVIAKLGTGGYWQIGFIPILLSPVAMLVLRLTLEYGKPSGMLDLRTQSWAFLVGDTVFLPFALAFAALGQRTLSASATDPVWYRSFWWLAAALVVGIVFAFVFRVILDAPNYVSAGAAELLNSPTKIWHDYVVYPALAGGIVHLAVPVVVHNFTGYGWLILVAIGGWGLMGFLDGVRGLNPRHLHPPVSKTWLASR